jgi:sulfhydrogenase subunit beta (sulfur reductase)
MRKISLDKIDSLFEAIAAENILYLPVDTKPSDSKSGAQFIKWTPGTKLSNALNTMRSAKDFFFPQSENLMCFKTEGKKIEIIDIRSEHEDFVVFGVRGCDARAFAVLDNVFLSEPVDTFYKNRRDHGVIISLACTRPAETCFCRTFGIDAADPDGDIVCYKTNDSLYFRAKTDKGEALLAKLVSVTEESDTAEVEAQKQLIAERMTKLPLASLKADAFGGGKTSKFFDAPEWKELSESCIGCGTCTYVCPTCQCYDIKDFDTGNGIIRHRCWDSCMYSEFTKMSAGQPRVSQLERFRQRFMHKLVYYPENNNGLFSCVGCGRCVSKCPIGMNIVKVMKKLGGNADA